MAPTTEQVIIGIGAVMLGCLATTWSFGLARKTGNWLYYFCVLGSGAFVLGIVGQQVFPTAAEIGRLGAAGGQTVVPGLWEAGVSIPLLGFRVTPVALGGLIVAMIGLSLVLLFESEVGSGVMVKDVEEDLDTI